MNVLLGTYTSSRFGPRISVFNTPMFTAFPLTLPNLTESPMLNGRYSRICRPPRRLRAKSWLARPRAMVRKPSEAYIDWKGRPAASMKKMAQKNRTPPSTYDLVRLTRAMETLSAHSQPRNSW